jgi:4'-phosphopantetheinyl transferase
VNHAKSGEVLRPDEPTAAVDLWFIALDHEDSTVRQFTETLSDSERERAQRFAHRRDRARYVSGRYAMRCVLSRMLNVSPKKVALGVGDHDKPFLIGDTPLAFNLSHSGGLAVLALVDGSLGEAGSAQAPCEVGVDIETSQALTESETLFKHCLSERELRGLRAIRKDEQHEVFFEIWVRKEACLKALGIGFDVEPHCFDSGWRFNAPDAYSCGSDIVKIVDRPTTMVSQLKDINATLEVFGFNENASVPDRDWSIPVSPPHWHGAVALIDKIPLPRIRRFEFQEG